MHEAVLQLPIAAVSQTGQRRGLCLVIAAPSGAGKSTILKAVLSAEPAVRASVSVTTRAPRPGEREGVDYYFRTPDAFEQMIRNGDMLEHAVVFGRFYGTPRGPVEAHLSAGTDVVFDIDWQGWQQLRAALPQDAVGVFILPPSITVLESRLRLRASDEEAEMAKRMRAARAEISHWAEFDYVLVNDDLAACVTGVRTILHAARCTSGRSLGAARQARAMASGDLAHP